MLNIIRFEWNDEWTTNQIKWIEKRYETLSRFIKQRKYEFDDISNLDDVTTYFHESILESNRNIKHIILDDKHTRFTTLNDQHDVYSMLSNQFFNAYFVIRSQLEYNYHSEFESSTSVIFAALIRAYESPQSIKHKHLKHLALRINTHVRSFYLLISFRINMHAHHHHLKSSFLHRHLEISHRMSRHRSCLDSQRTFSRNCRNWTKFIRRTRNSRIQTITLTSNWKSSSINVNVSNYHRMRTWKKRHLCWRNEHYFIFMIINTKTLHSTNFVSIWRNSLKNQNESVSIWRNDNSFISTMSSLLTKICS
jgi:hypothetical protein